MNARNLLIGLLTTAALNTTAAHAAGITRKSAPNAVIASSTTVPAGSTIIYLSGATASPIDPKVTDTHDAYGDTKVQTLSVLTKMKAQLAEMGLGMGDVVKLTVFLVGDPAKGGKMDRDGMTEAYKTFFGTADQPNLPARTTVQVAALGRPQTLVEIEAVVAK